MTGWLSDKRPEIPAHSPVDISVIVPLLNEQESLEPLHQQLRAVLDATGQSYEIVLVDDGSSDGSGAICRQLVDDDDRVLLVELRRNFGKATALAAGFQVARGNVLVTMDADLQDDPTEIPRMLAAIESGADLVSGWKRERHDPLGKKLPSRLFNRVTSRFTGIPLHDFNCGLKAYRREVVEDLELYGELHRYIPVLAHAKGFRIAEIPVRHHERRFGKSKYSFERFARGALDLMTVLFLTVFQRRPLHLFGSVGAIFVLTGLLIDGYLALLWFTGTRPIGDRPLLMLGTMLIILGVQVFLFGLLAEMIAAFAYRRDTALHAVRHVVRHSATGRALKATADVPDPSGSLVNVTEYSPAPASPLQ